jgi:hypothetical protein
MTITKANYKLPEKKHIEYDEKTKEKLARQKFEEKSIKARGATGSFMIFREEGLEDVFVVDDL